MLVDGTDDAHTSLLAAFVYSSQRRSANKSGGSTAGIPTTASCSVFIDAKLEHVADVAMTKLSDTR